MVRRIQACCSILFDFRESVFLGTFVFRPTVLAVSFLFAAALIAPTRSTAAD